MTIWLPILLLFLPLVPLLVLTVVYLRKRKAIPSLIIGGGSQAGKVILGIKATPASMPIYRLRASFMAPEQTEKEGFFTLTFDPPRGGSFAVEVSLPPDWAGLNPKDRSPRKAIISVDFRTVDQQVISRSFSLPHWNSRIGRPLLLPEGWEKWNQEPDLPAVSSLAYPELVKRKIYLAELAKAAEIKAAARETRKTPPPVGAT